MLHDFKKASSKLLNQSAKNPLKTGHSVLAYLSISQHRFTESPVCASQGAGCWAYSGEQIWEDPCPQVNILVEETEP